MAIYSSRVVRQFDDILTRFEQVDRASRDQKWDEKDQAELGALIQNAIVMYRPAGAAVYSDRALASCEGDWSAVVALRKMAGLLAALRSDYAASRLQSVSSLAYAKLADEFLEVAARLLAEGRKDAAAVSAGMVLEVHLRKLWERHLILEPDPDEADGEKVKGLETLIDGLLKDEKFTPIEHKDIAAQVAIRDAAVLGESDRIDEGQVGRMIEAVRSLIVRHPA
jgi:hypothetical protein